MTLQLDARQRAMLAEMGVRHFVPDPHLLRSEWGTPPSPPRQAGGIADLRPAIVKPAPEVERGSVPVSQAATEGTNLPQAAALGWEDLAEAVAQCRACGLCEGRRNTVFGVGDRQAEWLVVGEAPGENEDRVGEPFVGPAGQLLDNMLAALGVSRRQGAYIANVLKCRPPGNRNPEPAEVAQCEPFLRRQVELLQPKIILAMGRFAVHTLLQSDEPIGRLRGRVHRYLGVPVIVTYHPAYLLRNPADKAKAWADLCLAQAALAGARDLT